MTQFVRSARLVALSLSIMLVAAACSPAPSANPTAVPQPATTEAKPAESCRPKRQRLRTHRCTGCRSAHG